MNRTQADILRTQTTKSNTTPKNLPFVIEYHTDLPHISNILNTHWPKIQTDRRLNTLWQKAPFTAYRRGKNLKDRLVRARFRWKRPHTHKHTDTYKETHTPPTKPPLTKIQARTKIKYNKTNQKRERQQESTQSRQNHPSTTQLQRNSTAAWYKQSSEPPNPNVHNPERISKQFASISERSALSAPEFVCKTQHLSHQNYRIYAQL